MSLLLINASAEHIPLRDGSIHAVVTSPPYYGLRDYGLPPMDWPEVTYMPMAGLTAVTIPAWRGCLGLEPEPLMLIGHIVQVFREVWRVLRDDGTAWVNFGDSYAGSASYGKQNLDKFGEKPGTRGGGHKQSSGGIYTISATKQGDRLKSKDLVGIPWRVAFALQADGWYLRSDVIWHKPNSMPESVTDRPTKGHEYIFLLSKSQQYFYDHEAIKTPMKMTTVERAAGGTWHNSEERPDVGFPGQPNRNKAAINRDIRAKVLGGNIPTVNRRSVWTIATKPYSGAHFAVFPPELPRICLKASTSERGVCPECGAPWQRVTVRGEPTMRPDNPNPVRPYTAESGWTQGTNGTTLHMTRKTHTAGWQPTCAHDVQPVPAIVLDPFAGSGTTLLVARELGLRGIGLDYSFDYLQNQARPRLALDALEAMKTGAGIVDEQAYDNLPLFRGRT